MGHLDLDVQRQNVLWLREQEFLGGNLNLALLSFDKTYKKANGLDNDAIHQRIVGVLAEHQRREANSRHTSEQRLNQLRHDFQDAIFEHAVSFNRISQEFHGRGARHEQLPLLAHNTVTSRLEDIHTKCVRQEEWMDVISRERDRMANEVCSSIGAIY